MTFPISLKAPPVMSGNWEKTMVGAPWPAVFEAAARVKPGDGSLANRRAVGAAGRSAYLARRATRARRSRSGRFSRT